MDLFQHITPFPYYITLILTFRQFSGWSLRSNHPPETKATSLNAIDYVIGFVITVNIASYNILVTTI